MNMQIAFLLLTASILAETTTAQVSSHKHRLRALSGEQENFPSEYKFLSMSAALIEGNSAKSSPSTDKSSKSGKSGKSSKASCETNDFLQERFGPQLCPSEIEEKFIKSENTVVVSAGLVNFKSPGFSIPIVDSFRTFGRIDLTYDQTQTVCLTMCENNPNCGTVTFQAFSFLPGSKPDYRCIMFDPKLGTGAFLIDEPIDHRAPFEASVTYRKTLSVPLPPYEVCNVSTPDIVDAVLCSLEQITDPDVCDGLLTEDFGTFIAPAADCLLNEGILFSCLGCLNVQTISDMNQICLIDEEFSVIRGDCGVGCSNNGEFVCENEIQQALLCLTGQPLDRTDDVLFGGFVNRPNNYTCPVE